MNDFSKSFFQETFSLFRQSNLSFATIPNLQLTEVYEYALRKPLTSFIVNRLSNSFLEKIDGFFSLFSSH